MIKLGLAFWSSRALLMWHELRSVTYATPPPLMAKVMPHAHPNSCHINRAQRRGCQCVKGCRLCGGGFAPPMQEVGFVVVVVVWWNVTDVIVWLLVLSRMCCTSGIVCGLPMGFWWSVKISWRMGLSPHVMWFTRSFVLLHPLHLNFV